MYYFGSYSSCSTYLTSSLTVYWYCSSVQLIDPFLVSVSCPDFFCWFFFACILCSLYQLISHLLCLVVKEVCYLSSYGEDFKGGLFHFQDGEPLTILPMAGVSTLFIFFLQQWGMQMLDEVMGMILMFFILNSPQDVVMYTADDRNVHSVDVV